MRTSSILPLNYSPQSAFPPIFSGPEDTAMGPAKALVAFWTPSTYSLQVVPSQVVARCDHAPAGRAAVPGRSAPPIHVDGAMPAYPDAPYSE